eukprot:14882777-Ditylum_brightwellii.AAC.1
MVKIKARHNCCPTGYSKDDKKATMATKRDTPIDSKINFDNETSPHVLNCKDPTELLCQSGVNNNPAQTLLMT